MMNNAEFAEDAEAAAAEQAGRRSTWVSAAVNTVIGTLQIAVGLLAGSQAVVADGVHSFSDLIADFAVIFAGRYGSKDPDDDHPYGHRRAENAASLFLGLLLVAVGAGMLWSAIGKLENVHQIPAVGNMALAICGLTLIAKESLFRYMLKIATEARSSLLVANAWHARSDAASSLVAGIGVAGNLMGYRLLDPLAALIVGLVICRMGWQFAYEALHDLIDRAADLGETRLIEQTLLQTSGVQGVHGLRTRKMGDLLIVDVHLEVNGDATVREGHQIALDARNSVLAEHKVLEVMTHVDPV